jgi:YesN/AraC family two-component response regulator
LPDGSGLDIVKAAHARNPGSLVTIITGFASLNTAIEAIRLGAYDYITKPFSLDEIGVQVRNMMERISLAKENARLSIRLQELYEQVRRLQNERGDALRVQQDILNAVQENGRKLDQLLQSRPHPSAAPRPAALDARVDRNAVSTLFRELEKLDRLRVATPLSSLEVEERKFGLIDEFVGKL